MTSPAKEFEAIQAIHNALEPLDEVARTRILAYIASLLDINAKLAGSRSTTDSDIDEEATPAPKVETDDDAPGFSTFAELFASTSPRSNGERALVAGYWLQVCQKTESFTAAAANKELTNLGHKIANITVAINSVKNQKPMLILQLKKSGTSQQARKLYKVSHEGVQRIEAMIGG